jgi:hypothetical protein
VGHQRLSPHHRSVVAFAAAVIVAAGGLAACGGGNSSNEGANADATAACAALGRSNPVGAGTLALHDRLLGAAQLGLAAVGENGSTYSNLSGAFSKIVTDVNADDVNQLNGDVSNALALCKGDSLPH